MAIVKTPGTCGGKARIDGTRLAVWLFVYYFDVGISDADILKSLCHPTLKLSDLDDVREYIANNREEIVQDLLEQWEA